MDIDEQPVQAGSEPIPLEQGPGLNENHPIDAEIRPQTNTIAAIYQHERSFLEIGLAVIDLDLSTLCLDEFKDSRDLRILTSKLAVFEPNQVIVSNSLLPGINPLCELIRDQLKDRIVPTKSQSFNVSRGHHTIEKYCSINGRNLPELLEKNLAISSVAALFKHIDGLKNVQFAPKSVRLRLESDENSMLIDSNTSKCLELISNARNPKSSNNLLGLLDATRTKNGKRSLRANILQPPSNAEVIEQRLDAVESLFNDLQLYSNLSYMIRKFTGLGEIVKYCQQPTRISFEGAKRTENKILYVLGMRIVLEEALNLFNLVQSSNCSPIKSLFEGFVEVDRINAFEAQLDAIVEPNSLPRLTESVFKANKCLVLKTKLDGFLDVARQAYIELINSMNEYMTELCEKTNLPIKVEFNQARGFYFSVSLKSDVKKTHHSDASSIFSTRSNKFLESLPSEFIKITMRGSQVHFTTKRLMEKNERVFYWISEAFPLSDNILNQLLDQCRPFFDCFFKMSECLSTLDILLSLVNYLVLYRECTRPKFTQDLVLIKSCHPVLASIKDNAGTSRRNETLVVSNDCVVQNSISVSHRTPFVLLTGPNMSGKSTFLKQIGNVQVLAQCGSFVPASETQLSLKKRIFALTGESSNDTTIKKLSSFGREMTEIKYILQNWTEDSLILVDEMCRNTNYFEGLALSIAIVEQMLVNLASSSNVTVFFATHFQELAFLQYFNSSIKCFFFESIQTRSMNRLSHTYQLKKGVNQVNNYGFELMAIHPLPSLIIQDAKMIATNLDTNLKNLFTPGVDMLKKRLVMDLWEELAEIASEISSQEDINEQHIEKIEGRISHFESEYSKLLNI